MESEQVCVILMCLCGVCWEQHVTTLPAFTRHVKVGEDVTLQCPLLDASNTTSSTTEAPPGSAPPGPAPYILSWYRKLAGQSPEMLLTIRSTNSSEVKYGSSVRPDKVTAADDGSLRLHGSQRSDAAVYYCGISQGENRMVGGRTEREGPLI